MRLLLQKIVLILFANIFSNQKSNINVFKKISSLFFLVIHS